MISVIPEEPISGRSPFIFLLPTIRVPSDKGGARQVAHLTTNSIRKSFDSRLSLRHLPSCWLCQSWQQSPVSCTFPPPKITNAKEKKKNSGSSAHLRFPSWSWDFCSRCNAWLRFILTLRHLILQGPSVRCFDMLFVMASLPSGVGLGPVGTAPGFLSSLEHQESTVNNTPALVWYTLAEVNISIQLEFRACKWFFSCRNIQFGVFRAEIFILWCIVQKYWSGIVTCYTAITIYCLDLTNVSGMLP